VMNDLRASTLLWPNAVALRRTERASDARRACTDAYCYWSDGLRLNEGRFCNRRPWHRLKLHVLICAAISLNGNSMCKGECCLLLHWLIEAPGTNTLNLNS